MDSRRIILRSLFTEKSTRQQDMSNQYVFAVDPRANKRQIADAIEQLFEVKVLQVRTQNRMGKIHAMGRYSGRRADWKKAIVTLAEGNSIEMYENL